MSPYRVSAREPADETPVLGPWLARFAIVVSLLPIAMLWEEGCQNGQPPNLSPNVVQDVTVGVDAAICALNHYATDVANGMAPALIVEDIAVTCGIPVAKVTGLLDAHKAAMAKEAAVKR